MFRILSTRWRISYCTARKGRNAGVPQIELLHHILTLCFQQPHKVYECPFPHAQLELMQEVGDKQLVEVEAKVCEAQRES